MCKKKQVQITLSTFSINLMIIGVISNPFIIIRLGLLISIVRWLRFNHLIIGEIICIFYFEKKKRAFRLES